MSGSAGRIRPDERKLLTVAYGCYCGSVLVGTSNDPDELARPVGVWLKLHPDGRTFSGVYHERTTVAHARALRERRGQKVDRSRVNVVDRTLLN